MSNLANTRRVYLTAALFGVAVFVGTFGGLAAWNAYTDHRAAAKIEAQAAEAAAELKTPLGRQREAIRRFVNDPSSLVFRNERASKSHPEWWCGEMNAKNRMGAYVGFTRYVVELNKSPDLAQFDEATVEPNNSSEPSQRLIAYWEGYCR